MHKSHYDGLLCDRANLACLQLLNYLPSSSIPFGVIDQHGTLNLVI